MTVTFETVNGATANNPAIKTTRANWATQTVQFIGTGIIKVTISDDNFSTPVTQYLEVVDATNVTGFSGTISGNVVLLNDCGLSSLTISGRNTVYGNGFTATYTGNGQYLNNGLKQGVITVSENGTLDNLRIKASIYPSAYLYYSEAQNGPKDVEGTKDRYHYQLSAVAASGNATISNCYIYGGRTNIYIGDGNVTVKDSVLECGTLANVQIISSNAYSVSFEDVTTIQHQVKATVGDTNKVMLGAGIIVGDGDKDNTDATAPALVLKGNFKQYNWVNADDKNAVSDSNAKMIISGALDATWYNHTINGKTASNLGIIYMNNFEGNFKNETGLPYEKGTVELTLSGFTVSRTVYSLKNAKSNQIYSDHANADKSTVNGLYQPQFKYDNTLGDQYIAKTDDGDEFCYREGDTIYVLFPSGDTKELDLAKLVNIAKYTGQNLGLTITCKDSQGNAVAVNGGKVSLSAAGEYTVTYTVTDTLFYDKEGNKVTHSETYSWDVTIAVALKEMGIPNARFEFNTTDQKIFRSGNSSIVQFIPFLSGLKIYDYNENGEEYLRFDGGNTEATTDYDKIADVTINNVNTTGEAQGYHIVTVELDDGGKIVIDMDVRANSGSSKHSGSIKVRNNVVYVVNDGTTSGKGQTWKIYSYKFVGNNGTEIDSGLITFGTAGEDCSTATKPTTNFGSTESGGGSDTPCFTGDTLITLADGTQKRIDALTFEDKILAWDFFTGTYVEKKISLLVDHGMALNRIANIVMSDGTMLRIVGEHGVFDYDLNKFVYITPDNVATYVGHRFVQYNAAGGYDVVTMVDGYATEEYCGYYSVSSAGTSNAFASGLLTVAPPEDFYNWIEMDGKLHYDVEQFQKQQSSRLYPQLVLRICN